MTSWVMPAPSSETVTWSVPFASLTSPRSQSTETSSAAAPASRPFCTSSRRKAIGSANWRTIWPTASCTSSLAAMGASSSCGRERNGDTAGRDSTSIRGALDTRGHRSRRAL